MPLLSRGRKYIIHQNEEEGQCGAVKSSSTMAYISESTRTYLKNFGKARDCKNCVWDDRNERMREMRREGYKVREIAEEFGLSRQTVGGIVAGEKTGGTPETG